ncbi:ATP-binding protein [Psychromarinibacter sp. C21-152]|uniref:C4-dicarboxylate transport sensor protein DctB n=1 Tax=Psychromarinibacter sediminicola TaxID=3033385 RepID=A0AAE3NSW4_9RHOB|nr:ATP-binding protein [Psychromarinibacter sediminicola]MDF0601467.1 ATP-binding protein [Psychromarinibacter sediminicola]
MRRLLRRRMAVLAGFLLAVAGFAAVIWWIAFAAALDQLEERGHADLSLAADRLTGQLRRVRDVAVLVADHPVLVPLVLGTGGDEAAADALLQAFADRSGAQRLWLADDTGRVLAASDPFAARHVGGSGAFRRAMDGALGLEHGVDADSAQRFFTYAAPVFSPEGPAAGAVMVRVNVDELEWNWPADPSPVIFTDARGVVFVSNRSDLTLSVRAAPPDGDMPDEVYVGAVLSPFPARAQRVVRGHDLWALEDSPYLPRYALHLTQPRPVIGMTAEILVNLAPALRLASLQAAVAAALCLAFGALLFYLAERRRALAERLDIEERANAALEARVAERTEALSAVNADLRREVGERREAEAALKRAQADLVQAGKLSALGQMSAGISHELNQPLMAIQSFADNGAVFVERGKPERAAENLTRIGELARRMGRIIRNLRAFARQERADVVDVDLVAVVDAALEISEAKAARAGVTVAWDRPEGPVMVRGGEVRLQQVVMNLVSNAVDAMDGAAERRLELSVAPGDPVVLTVRDTGPGIAEPEKIFDPFYTTKAVGQGEGMGLGLSISYGLVQSFGGAIRGRNHPDGGAVFRVELAPVGAEAAA